MTTETSPDPRFEPSSHHRPQAGSREARSVVRIGGPPDVCEAVPYLVGFIPKNSLVAISLRGPRKKVGLVLRVDLVPERYAKQLAAMVTGHLVRDGAEAAVIVVYSGDRHSAADRVARAMLRELGREGVAVEEALRVTRNRWTSYRCSQPCCPPEGTPLRDRLANPGVFGAAMVAEGRQVLSSRGDLVRTVEPVTGPLAEKMEAALERESARLTERGQDEHHGPADFVAATVALAHEWATRLAPRSAAGGARASGNRRRVRRLSVVGRGGRTDTPLPVEVAARLLVGLVDKAARDELLPWGGSAELGDERPTGLAEGFTALWRDLTRRAVLPGYAAAPATLLGWSAYLLRGDGSVANVAAERALNDSPGYLLAEYLGWALDHALHPEVIRKLLSESPESAERNEPADTADGADADDGADTDDWADTEERGDRDAQAD